MVLKASGDQTRKGSMADGKLQLTKNALTVLENRYLNRDDGGKVVESPEELFRRVARTIATVEEKWGSTAAEMKAAEDRYFDLMTTGQFLPNSPTLMNAGRRLGMLSACFVLPLEDSIPDIMETARQIALVQRAGGGTGVDLSRLRPRGSIVRSSGGTTEGPLSFLKMLSSVTDAIQQGAFRRGANMGMMRVDHPDVIAFIRLKEDLTQVTNYNLSVSMTDEFMRRLQEAPNEPHRVVNPQNGEIGLLKKSDGTADYAARREALQDYWTVREVWDLIVEKAWKSGEPGLIFIDEVNRHNQTPNVFEMRATNPCGEQPLGPYEACFAPDTRVTTDRGLETIADLFARQKAGHRVLVATALQPQDDIVFRPALISEIGERETVYVELANGQKLRCTPDHRLYTTKGWKRADQLDIGKDDIVIQGRMAGTLVDDEPEYVKREEQTYGWFTGDGWFTRNAGITFGPEDRLAFETLIPVWRRVTGAPANEGPHEFVRCVATESKAGTAQLERVGFRRARSSERRVPTSVFTAAKTLQVAYLQGLFGADGAKTHNKPQVTLSSASKELLRDVQIILLNLGIRSSIKFSAKRERGRAQGQLKINGESYGRFLNIIGFPLTPAKAKRCEEHRVRRVKADRLAERVVAVKEGQKAMVYDVTEPVTNSLIAEGMVVHNCNLGSINLAKFYQEGARGGLDERIDWNALRDAVAACVRFLDGVVEANRYPTPEIHEACHSNRKIGLGVMGWADLLFKLGVRYDSEEALAIARRMGKFIRDTAWDADADLAEVRGVFPNWTGSAWDTVHHRKMRNAHCITIAPTGTISIIAGCSGGIEPIFSLAFVRQVLNGETLHEVNAIFERKLHEYFEADQSRIDEVIEHASANGTIQDLDLPANLKEVFRTARDISPEWHVRMQAVWQENTDAAVSKTINLPSDAEPKDVEAAYLLAYELKCKGITVYRDGSRAMQPMALKSETEKKAEAAAPAAMAKLEPLRLPEIMPCVRVRQLTPFGNMHVKISVEPTTGAEREVFAQLGKGGDLANSDLEAICRILSLFLRCNGSLKAAVSQLDGIGSSLSVPSKEGRIMSLADGLAEALKKYLHYKDTYGLKALLLGEVDFSLAPPEASATRASSPKSAVMYKIKCPACEGVLAFEEGCVKCHSCGFSQC
ncbi:MAG: ribonucleotide reductase N-terminal alpha domain-containing protein [Planctomycetota bacterium]